MLFLFLFFLIFAACERPKKPEILLFTTQLQGVLEPCGCTSDPLGDMARLATLVKNHPGADFLSAGDLLNDPTQESLCPDSEKSELILNTLQKLGLNPRSSPGMTSFQGLKIALSELPKDQLDRMGMLEKPDLIIWGKAPEDPPTPPFQLKHSQLWVFSAGSKGQYLGKLELINLNPAIKQALKLDTRKQDRAYERTLIEKRLESLKTKPLNDFVSTRIQLAEAELRRLDAIQDKVLEGPHMRFELIPIKRHIKPDPSIAALIQSYEKKLPQRLAACESTLECPTAKPGQATYVGDETCKTCHASAYAFWEKALVQTAAKDQTGAAIKRLAGHSKAWKTLEQANKTLDRSCIGCHSLGFMQPGGYCKALGVGAFKNVQCESCHGPGSLHAATANKSKIQRVVPESRCRDCHHVPHIPTEASFNYKDKLQVILGPGHGESLLLKLKN